MRFSTARLVARSDRGTTRRWVVPLARRPLLRETGTPSARALLGLGMVLPHVDVCAAPGGVCCVKSKVYRWRG